MRHGPRKTAEIRAEAIQMRKDGKTWAQVAMRFKVKQSWLKAHVAKHPDYAGVRDSLLKASPANLAKARELRAAGVCWKLVARQVGIDHWRTLQRAITLEDKAAADGKQ